ncbi:hypothetical protein HHK36_026194 [Tetracentron sinense]|uniref:Protein kinase domain-containing protein n=1 Tax=Tetracentron sinense TaxID=13715 RepID=A0A834YIQ6_TETSI|nr:hypothetical protein HHK36_026194 [Tetracentron sinense]
MHSFGIILWELITGMLPCQNIGDSDIVYNGVQLIIPNDCLPSLREIMTRCWDADPEIRPPLHRGRQYASLRMQRLRSVSAIPGCLRMERLRSVSAIPASTFVLHNRGQLTDLEKRDKKTEKIDPLERALMDSTVPTEGMESCEEKWKIDLEQLKMGISFEQGDSWARFGGTYRSVEVAIKILEREQLMEQQVQQEVKMLAELNHPNIVGFVGACRKPGIWCIVTEYADGGSVHQQCRPVPLKLAIKQALDVAKGMAYLHGLGFSHMDLNSHNLLIFKDNSIKISVFRGAPFENQSYRWMAPELIRRGSYTQKVDVYSFGIVLWELITGMLPFHNIEASDILNKGVRPIIPKDSRPLLTAIMARCWDANPDVRPPFTEVVKMLEKAYTQINVPVPGFRCCFAQPRTAD